VLERTAIAKIGSDRRRPKRVIADRREDAGRGRTSADHPPGIRLHHRPLGEHGRVVPRTGAEQETLAVLGDAGGTSKALQVIRKVTPKTVTLGII